MRGRAEGAQRASAVLLLADRRYLRAIKEIIEVDGGQHFESKADEAHDAYLRSRGFRVLRLWNTNVLANRDGVDRAIMTALTRCAPDGAAPSSSCA